MEIFITTLCFISAYLTGAIPTAYIAGKILRGIDIRQYGSGNVGATNVFRSLGKKAGIAVLAIDIAKGVVAVTLIPYLFKYTGVDFSLRYELVRTICGILAVAGHVWTVFLRFRGGKGVATTVGIFLGLTPVSMLIAVGVFTVAVALTRYISLGSMLLGITLFISNLLMSKYTGYIVISGILAVLIFYTHRSNIKRLIAGTENKLGAKSNLQKEAIR